MTTDLSSWQRIERVMNWAGMNSASFAAVTGLSSPQIFYQIKAGKSGISRELAERITNRFAEVSFAWLLTGEGTMFRPLQTPVPCYSADCMSLALLERLPEAESTVLLPDSEGCTFAARTFSPALEPEIPRGSLIVLSRVEPANITAGGIYLIAGGGVALLRRVKSVDCAVIRFAPFDEISGETVFDATLVRRAFQVRFSIQNHSI